MLRLLPTGVRRPRPADTAFLDEDGPERLAKRQELAQKSLPELLEMPKDGGLNSILDRYGYGVFYEILDMQDDPDVPSLFLGLSKWDHLVRLINFIQNEKGLDHLGWSVQSSFKQDRCLVAYALDVWTKESGGLVRENEMFVWTKVIEVFLDASSVKTIHRCPHVLNAALGTGRADIVLAVMQRVGTTHLNCFNVASWYAFVDRMIASDFSDLEDIVDFLRSKLDLNSLLFVLISLSYLPTGLMKPISPAFEGITDMLRQSFFLSCLDQENFFQQKIVVLPLLASRALYRLNDVMTDVLDKAAKVASSEEDWLGRCTSNQAVKSLLTSALCEDPTFQQIFTEVKLGPQAPLDFKARSAALLSFLSAQN